MPISYIRLHSSTWYRAQIETLREHREHENNIELGPIETNTVTGNDDFPTQNF